MRTSMQLKPVIQVGWVKNVGQFSISFELAAHLALCDYT